MSDGFEWLDWLEPSGPFVAAPVLKKAFPQGLDTLDPNKRRSLRQAYDEYRQALDDEDPEAGKFHAAWIDLVIEQGLEYDEDESGDNLKSADDLPDSLVSQVAEHGVTLRPDYAVVDDQSADKPMMLIQIYDQDDDLNDAVRDDGWASSPKERMVRLCRDTGTRLGLVTNGEHWLFVDAPIGAVSSFASWYARLWGPEPVLLQAFVVLLGIRRFFVVGDEQLPALIDKSVEYQDEVTEALGEQVRRAVEVLIQALDKADVDRNRELLKDVDPRELYEAGLTVMMRLVFLLSAEERELLLLGDERYEANYAVSTLRMQLRGEDDAILQRRWDSWSRLLAIFRAIFGGIEHETLRMPALGGSLFDPDRFPFLEGRDKDSNWKTDPAKPLPIDNQTVLLLLDAIQLFEGRTLSYRGLDIEQLGYVYEGLLDHTVKRAKEVTLELDATKSSKQPWVTLGELESARLDGKKAVEKLLKERTGSSISRVRNDLKKEVKPQQSMSLLTACHNDKALHDQLKQFFHLIRTDSWGRPLVYPEGSFMVTTGDDRRQTGSHYTPTSLTEAIVKETLEPVVYAGPAEGKPREEWQLKSPVDLLDLKICDPAMGSGAFLVQICRWLGERVVESWSHAETSGHLFDANGELIVEIANSELLPNSIEERSIIARRLIAERCIYGVDLNPLAVDLAKLSIWLVTLAKGRPFGFLDHSLKCGDSLLGIHRIDQLAELSYKPRGMVQSRLFGKGIQKAVERALELRQELRKTKILDIHDVENMEVLNAQADAQLELPTRIANAFIGAVFASNDSAELENRINGLATLADELIKKDDNAASELARNARDELSKDAPKGRPRVPFHWAIEFPEVFQKNNGGFDAITGNPPFLGGKKITGIFGVQYREFLVKNLSDDVRGESIDIVAYFFLRVESLIRNGGNFGLLAVNTIAEGATRRAGLELVLKKGCAIYRAYRNEQWPGKAAVVTSRIQVHKGKWNGEVMLSGQAVRFISAYLSDHIEIEVNRLKANESQAFAGSVVLGLGFTLEPDQARFLVKKNPKNAEVLFPYLIGKDLNSHPKQEPSRFVINFFDWPLAVAEQYPDLLKIVRTLVKPGRDKNKRKIYRENWWRFAEKCPGLYHAIGKGDNFLRHPEGWDESIDYQKVLVSCRVTKYLMHTLVDSSSVFDVGLNVIVPRPGLVALLSSSVYECWVRKQSSSLKTDIRYTLKDCYETFPFPAEMAVAELELIGEEYHVKRAEAMCANAVGLTKFYNQFHNPSTDDAEVVDCRELQRRIDRMVADAFGWRDLDLGHDFHDLQSLPENDRTRFTICETARLAVLQRLSTLNQSRWKDESEGGRNFRNRDDKSRRKAITIAKTRATGQSDFDFGTNK